MHQIDIQIAGEYVRLREAADRATCLWPFWPMDLFQVPPQKVQDLGQPDIDIDITVVKELPECMHGKLIFDSDQGLWKLFEAEGGYYLQSLSNYTHQPYIRAVISPDFGKIQLWVQESRDLLGGEEMGWVPSQVLNPVVELCLLTRIAREGGVLLHASAVKVDNTAYVFSGPSGAGKSTIAEFFAERTACPILSDEKVIIRLRGNQLFAYGTPWYGSSHYATNDGAPLERFFLISHGAEGHRYRSLSFLEWTRRFLHECTAPCWDRRAMEQTMVFLDQLMTHSERQELAFLKDSSVVDFLVGSKLAQISQ